MLVVVFSFLVVSVSRSRGDRGRGSRWLFESAVYEVAFHSIPFRPVFHRGEPGHVAREIVVVSVGSVWLKVGVEVVLPSLDWSSLFAVTFLLGWYCRVPVGDELGPTAFVVLGNHPSLPPVDLALPEDLRRSAGSKSSALRVELVMWSTHGSSSSSGLSSERASKQGLLYASWLLSTCSLTSWLS